MGISELFLSEQVGVLARIPSYNSPPLNNKNEKLPDMMKLPFDSNETIFAAILSEWAFLSYFYLTNRSTCQNQLLQLCTACTTWSDSVIRLDSVIKLVSVFSVNVLPSWLQNADQ